MYLKTGVVPTWEVLEWSAAILENTTC